MSVYHKGELAVQAKAGVTHMAERVGRSITNDARFFGPFLEHVNLAVASSVDASGRVWASPLTGSRFIRLLDEKTVFVEATLEDALTQNLQTSPELGILAIDPSTRGRVRLNGHAQVQADGILLHTQQVYGNCPKYIQKRDLTRVSVRGAPEAKVLAHLTPKLTTWIQRADTFFIASRHPMGGADASHRGGQPGFVRVTGDELRWSDYQGNMMFNTLGNLHANPNAGLLFIDFSSGDTLQLFGQAAILWDDASAQAFKGAERVVSFRVEGVRVVQGDVPLLGNVLEYSPHNPR